MWGLVFFLDPVKLAFVVKHKGMHRDINCYFLLTGNRADGSEAIKKETGRGGGGSDS